MRTAWRLILSSALGLAALSVSAQSQPISSIDEYFQVAGEVTAGRTECQFAFNITRLTELGRAFQIDNPDEATLATMSDRLAQSMDLALSRIRDEGLDRECPRLLKSYGPNGSVAPGLLNSPGAD